MRSQLAAGYKVDVSEELRAYSGLAAHSLDALLASAEAGKPEVTPQIISETLKDTKDPYASYVNALVAFRRGQLPRAKTLLSHTKDLHDPFVLWYRGAI